MLTVRVYDNYNLIALQGLDTDDIEGCEFAKEVRAETSGDMEKLMACVGHSDHSNHSKIQLLCLCTTITSD